MKTQHILIIGGAGFIGINAARYFIRQGWEVTILDNFSRAGTKENVAWLEKDEPGKFKVVKVDIVKQYRQLAEAIATSSADVVLHLAAQVAVTFSITDPRHDFEVNALGSFNVLEAVRTAPQKPILLYSSTNKVYGSLPHHKVKEQKTRFIFKDADIEAKGISEIEPLDFHSPYGCSKGAADQYVIDYSRIYDLRTVVFRQSCIYGPFQFGIEDQGWVAWFTIATLFEKPITLFGNGKQVRDILYVEDLVRLYELAIEKIDKANGQAYNVGGGPKNTLSLLEFLDVLEEKQAKEISVSHADIRAGDQPIFVADIRKAAKELGWKPQWIARKGIDQMYSWIEENSQTIQKVLNKN